MAWLYGETIQKVNEVEKLLTISLSEQSFIYYPQGRIRVSNPLVNVAEHLRNVLWLGKSSATTLHTRSSTLSLFVAKTKQMVLAFHVLLSSTVLLYK